MCHPDTLFHSWNEEEFFFSEMIQQQHRGPTQACNYAKLLSIPVRIGSHKGPQQIKQE